MAQLAHRDEETSLSSPYEDEAAASAAQLMEMAGELRRKADVLEHAAGLLLHHGGDGDHPGFRHINSSMYEF